MTAEQPNVSRAGRYSVLHAARLMQVAPNTIRNWIKRGDIQCSIRKTTNTIYIEGAELLKVWNNHY